MEREQVQLQPIVRLKEAGVSYSLAAVLPIVVSLLVALVANLVCEAGYADSNWYKYAAYLIPQIGIATTVLVFFRRTKTHPKLIFCGCKWYYFPIAIVLAFGLLSLAELNNYFIKLLSLMGYEQAESSLPDVTGWFLLPALLVIAVLPALLEETLFRGIVSGRMREAGWGTYATVFLSGALFSLFHGNPEQTLYQFVCGACYTLVAVRSGSPLPTMLAHFLNNAVFLSLASAGYSDIPAAVNLPLYLVAGVCLVGVLTFLVFFDRYYRVRGGVKNGKVFFFTASVGIAACAVQWIAVLITGFSG